MCMSVSHREKNQKKWDLQKSWLFIRGIFIMIVEIATAYFIHGQAQASEEKAKKNIDVGKAT